MQRRRSARRRPRRAGAIQPTTWTSAFHERVVRIGRRYQPSVRTVEPRAQAKRAALRVERLRHRKPVRAAARPTACTTTPTVRSAVSRRRRASRRAAARADTRPGSPPRARAAAGGETRSRSTSPRSPPFAWALDRSRVESLALEVGQKMRCHRRSPNCQGNYRFVQHIIGRCSKSRSTRLHRG